MVRFRDTGLLMAGFALLGVGCTTNSPVQLSPSPDGLATYLQTSRPRNVQITDTAGRTVWLHNPAQVGDSLVGLLNWDDPRSRRSFPLPAIRTIAEPHFSAGRTLGLAGGILGSAGIALLIVATTGPEPVY